MLLACWRKTPHLYISAIGAGAARSFSELFSQEENQRTGAAETAGGPAPLDDRRKGAPVQELFDGVTQHRSFG